MDDYRTKRRFRQRKLNQQGFYERRQQRSRARRRTEAQTAHGLHLAQTTDVPPIRHDDPWVEKAANCFVACLDGWGEREPTEVEWDFVGARDIATAESLERDLLEARLIAQEHVDDIAARSRFTSSLITMYQKLFFDVEGDEGRRRWFAGPSISTPFMPLFKMTLGGAFKMLAYRNGSEALEDTVEVVFELAGPTLADGLPDTETLDGQKELRVRLDLAKLMLPPLRNGECLLDRLFDVPFDDEQPSAMTAEEIEEAVKTLSRAKLPKSVFREIQKLRQYASPAPETASAT